MYSSFIIQLIMMVSQNSYAEPSEWKKVHTQVRNSSEAELVVRTGDIDNLGFGWPKDFDPFTGRSTPVHRYPWTPQPQDPSGTDRIMLGSSHQNRADGYAGTTQHMDTAPQPIMMTYDLDGIEVKSALLQFFVDDFQSPVFGSHFQVLIDGQRMPNLETVLNTVRQTGPIGKLITFEILPEYLSFVKDGAIKICIDDPTSAVGDGYAVDFVRLLINPKEFMYTGSLHGFVRDAKTKRPIPNVLVSSALGTTKTDARGAYRFEHLPAGLNVIRGSRDGYEDAGRTVDLIDGMDARLDLMLKPDQATIIKIKEELKKKGRVELKGVFFEFDSAQLQDSSEPALALMLEVMRSNSTHRYRIEGHTDAKGNDDYNLRLSGKRAESVLLWLAGRGIDPQRLESVGYGETRPKARNDTDEGRSLNRRVELVLLAP